MYENIEHRPCKEHAEYARSFCFKCAVLATALEKAMVVELKTSTEGRTTPTVAPCPDMY